MKSEKGKPSQKNPPAIPAPEPIPIPIKPSCATIAHEQDAYLNQLCAKKHHRLSCKCSNCDSDGTYPVLSAPSDAPLLNTAYNGHGGFLTSGTDLHWETALGGPGGPSTITTPWQPAYVFYNTAWYASPFANANWISYYINSFQGSTDNVDAYFRFTFNLASSVNPSTFSLQMSFFADNRVAEIYVNGVAQSTQPNGAGILPQFPGIPLTQYQTDGFIESNTVSITLDNSWRPCENCVIVHVMSGPDYLGFLAQNAVAVEPGENGCDCKCHCTAVELPPLKPCISVSYGDSACDCLETDDVKVLCISVCNCYSNVTFRDLSIGQIAVTDLTGKPVPILPDGTPSVQVIPSGPICFGDIGPCCDVDHPTCVSRELVLYTRGAIGTSYKLVFNGICFKVCHELQSEQCFIVKLCQD